jgi:hypothetical protein
MAQHTIRPELCVQLHRKFITGPASISIDVLPCRVERDAVQFTNRIDKNTNALACRPAAMADERCIVSRHVSRSSPHTSASPSGCFAATSITICQMLCGRSAKAGTIRSPNHASDCSGGIEMFDQPIVVVILLLFLCCLGRSCRHVVVPKMLTQKANGSLVFRLSDSSNWPY